MYAKTTHSIRVTVEPQFLEDQSVPDENQYIWVYHIRIENQGTLPVQLKARQWEITDGKGQQVSIYGEGVVGEQPTLDPGEAFEYTSGVPLSTPSGIMRGSYKMINEIGDAFEVEIPAFSLDSPYENVILN